MALHADIHMVPQVVHIIVDRQARCMWYLLRQMKHHPDLFSGFFLSAGCVTDQQLLNECGWPQ